MWGSAGWMNPRAYNNGWSPVIKHPTIVTHGLGVTNQLMGWLTVVLMRINDMGSTSKYTEHVCFFFRWTGSINPVADCTHYSSGYDQRMLCCCSWFTDVTGMISRLCYCLQAAEETSSILSPGPSLNDGLNQAAVIFWLSVGGTAFVDTQTLESHRWFTRCHLPPVPVLMGTI